MSGGISGVGCRSHVADLMDSQAVDELMGAVAPSSCYTLPVYAPGRFWTSQENLRGSPHNQARRGVRSSGREALGFGRYNALNTTWISILQ